MKNFKRVLIINRGEIAHRISKTIKNMGLTPVMIYSDADRETLTIKEAEEAYRIGAAPVADSYLNQDKILKLAKEVKAEAIHPGYGLLSENSDFARRVKAEGLTWIGPDPDSMDRVASKSRAKEVAERAKVPTLPGHRGSQDLEQFIKVAENMGYPVLLKATAGGGGRGIRKVSNATELKVQIELARSEAKSAFGDDEILLEKFVEKAWHVEVQVFGDHRGNVVHLGERDCSAQRRNQKVIEESPSRAISEKLRKEITDSAVRLAREAKYTNAGTVEFLVTAEGQFYFLEMNTRLQVEHPVTEFVTGLDLVEWQIRIARDETLPLSQDQVTWKGHSIQARLYAEDPFNQYLPQTGRVRGFHFPENIRVDHFLSQRTEITPFYDSMIAKLIVYGKDRNEAIQKLIMALDESHIAGLVTNNLFLKEILESDHFSKSQTFTRTLDQMNLEKKKATKEELDLALKIAASTLYQKDKKNNWSNSLGRKSLFSLEVEGLSKILSISDEDILEDKISFITDDGLIYLKWKGQEFTIHNKLLSKSEADSAQDVSSVKAPMDGTLMKILVKENDEVKPGQVLAILEAMKMQSELKSTIAGVVEKVLGQEKQLVKNKQIIIKLKNT